MRKIVVSLLLLFLFFQSSLLAYSSNPKDFVNELVSEAINKLADKNLNKEQKSNFIEKVALEMYRFHLKLKTKLVLFSGFHLKHHKQ